MSSLAIKLCETSGVWRKQVAPMAEYVAQELSSSVYKPASMSNVARQLIATRLTQRNKREAKGAPLLPPSVRAPRRDNLCRGCGITISDGRTNCATCAVGDATKNMLDAARIGRQTANGPQAQVKRADTQRKNALAQHAWKPSDQPTWLTEKFYRRKSSRFSPRCQHPLSRDKSRFRTGMLGAYVRATDRIQGTGRCWQSLGVFQR